MSKTKVGTLFTVAEMITRPILIFDLEKFLFGVAKRFKRKVKVFARVRR